MARLLWVAVFSSVCIPPAWGLALQAASATADNLGIYGGHNVSIYEAPFMARLYAIHLHNQEIRECKCGGSIIHEKFILTAAHCIRVIENINAITMVGVGSDSINDDDLKSVDATICRDDYDPKQNINDVCLLRLASPLLFGPKISPINLPDEGYQVMAGTWVNLTGWGDTETKSTPKPLRQVTVPILMKMFCPREKLICAGLHGMGGCYGDSGGPVTYNNTIIGVASAVREECGGRYGFIAAEVARYIPWINTFLKHY